jgi:hypothetical protein
VAGNTLIIILAAALVLAVGVLLFGVGRIVYGIAHYYLRERQPTHKVQHPAYGLLTGEGEIWSGTAQTNGREVHFTVAGTDSAPDDQLLQRVGGIIGRFSEVERQAAEHLRKQEAEIGKAALEVYGLDVTEGTRPDDFTVEFLADGDESHVWRVEFQAGQPKQTGFDD